MTGSTPNAAAACAWRSQNYNSFNNPKITSALEQARSTADPDKRAALVAQAEKLTVQQMPWIPNVQPTSLLMLSKSLTGAVSSFAYMFAPWANSWAGAAEPARRAMRWRFFARRLAMLVASLLIASFVIFAALYLAPGNPVAALSGGRSLPASSIAVLEQRYHLNQPFLAQYWYWLENALHGNLGISITLRENVSTLIASRIWTTAGLVLYASLIIVVLGIGLGIAGRAPAGALDTGTLVTTAVSAAIPAFVAAIVLILRVRRQARLVPGARQRHRPRSATSGTSRCPRSPWPSPRWRSSPGSPGRRSARKGEREHVQTAVSRGIPARQLIQRHILRNAAIPITTITGITIASLIAVAAVVEVAFSLNGLGAYLVEAAQSKDLAVVQGISLVLVTAFVVVNVMVDVLYAVLDPRVALGSRAQ